MEYLRLALKNLLRRKTRTLLTLVGIGVAIAVLYSLLEFQQGYEQGLNAEINQLGAHIMVVPKGCPYEAATIVLHGGKWPRYMEESYFDKIAATPGVSQAAPILMDAMINPATKDNKIFLGITEAYGTLRPKWTIQGTSFSTLEAREVILGTSIAEKLRLKPGDTFHLRQDAAGRAAGKKMADRRQNRRTPVLQYGFMDRQISKYRFAVLPSQMPQPAQCEYHAVFLRPYKRSNRLCAQSRWQRRLFNSIHPDAFRMRRGRPPDKFLRHQTRASDGTLRGCRRRRTFCV